jgi:predicted RNA-binding Zn-ribbon protein involved in translation (DUF1610 family)
MGYKDLTAEEKRLLVISLFHNVPQICPECGEAELVPLHPRRKSQKGDDNWKCPACGEVIRLFNLIPLE